MTRLGKILVLLNLGLAVMLAAWSFNVYNNGIDWTDRKDTKSTPPRTGRFAVRDAKLKDLWNGLSPAESDWMRERERLAKEESGLAVERVWYDKEIRYVLAGPAKNRGIREVALAGQDNDKLGVKKGQVLLDNQGNPQLVPIRDPAGNALQLQSLAEYNKEDESVLKEIANQIELHQKQIADANALTDKIIGDKAKGIRGLQQRIYDEQDKNVNVIAEIKRIEPLFINTLVEGQLVSKRHTQMERRIKELKKINVASK